VPTCLLPRADRLTKRRLYQEVGVATYWVVDPDGRAVEVWTPADTFPTVQRERVVWTPEGASEPLTLELTDLFPPI
jgi:Uma2 family endonuclease